MRIDEFIWTRIDADAVPTGHQAFSFNGTAAVGNVAGYSRAIHEASGIQADVNGDGLANFAIQFNANATAPVNDILL